MIKDCLRIFEKELVEKGENLILDNYVPKNGTYLLIKIEGENFYPQEPIDILYVKKTKEKASYISGETNTNYQMVRRLDYYSKLIEMNKPIDGKKIIHSNNYLSFFIKKESLSDNKLTDDMIDGYYDILRNPVKKYEKNKKAVELYNSIEKEIGEPDTCLIKKIHNWIKDNIRTIDLGSGKKDYLKLFFVFSDKEDTFIKFIQEGKRYLIPNIYNNNDSNIIVNDKVYGLPNDNMGMNSKKPYLENKSRKIKEPYLLNMDEVVLQSRFFDYLMGKVSLGYVNVYIDTNNENIKFYDSAKAPDGNFEGIFLRLIKGKEVEIHSCDYITDYSSNLKRTFIYKDIIELNDELLKNFETGYGVKTNMNDMRTLINDVFFNKWLVNNFFTKPEALPVKDGIIKYNILLARERLFDWLYKGSDNGIFELLMKISENLIKNTILNGSMIKAKHQVNLRWSLMDYFNETNEMEEHMSEIRSSLREHINSKEEWGFTNSDEYYYAVGQLVSYYVSINKGKKVKQSFINPFLNAKKDEVIKKHLTQLYKRVNYDINYRDFRVNNLVSKIMTYRPGTNVSQDLIIGGFTDNLLIYEK